MSSVPKAAWRVVARRAGSDRAILAAVFAAVLLAITLMAAGPIYIEAVTLSSLRRTLADSTASEANLAVTTRVNPVSLEEADNLVVDAIADTFADPGAAVFRRGTSDTFNLAGLEGDHENQITVFRWYTGLEDRAGLVEGSWPRVRSDRIEVAVPASTASALGLSIGDRFDTVNRSDSDFSLEVTVSGIYEPDDPSVPYWLADELDISGVVESTALTTLGPLVVDVTVFYTDVATGSSAMRWSAFPDFDAIEVDDMSPIVGGLDRLDETLNSGRTVNNQMHVETDLSSILRDTGRSLLVTRSAVLILTVQMAVLALYALFLAANLLADSREIETDTLRARGSSNWQILSMSVSEGLMVTFPAFVLGPYLAAWVLRGLNVVGPLTGIGLDIEPRPVTASWLLAGLASVCCISALMIPAYRSARRFGSVRADRARQAASPMARRAGVDIALLAVAGLGLWQLARYGAPLTQTIQGSLVVDPLLVAAPALALVAGAVLSLRALPLLARLGEGLVSSGRRLVPALGVWHLGRQSKRFSRSALVLTLALAIGVFALAYDATWQRSQTDQAGFINGADVETIPSALGGSLPASVLSDAYSSLDSIEGLTPVLDASGEIGDASLPIDYRALDSTTAQDVILFREDQAGVPIEELIGRLPAARPEPWGIELPGAPARLAVEASLSLEPLEEELAESAGQSAASFTPNLRAVVVDGNGVPLRIEIGEIHQTGESIRLSTDLTFTGASEEVFAPSYPLRLIGFETNAAAPFEPFQRNALLTISDLEISEDGASWEAVAIPGDAPVETAVSSLRFAAQFPEATLVPGDRRGITIELLSGTVSALNRQPVHHMAWLDDRPEVESIPVLISAALAEDLAVGEGATIPLAGFPIYDGPATVVGTFDTFPTIDPNTRHAAVIDYPTYMAAVFDTGVYPPDPGSYWIAVEDDHLVETADLLRKEPFLSTSVTTRQEVVEDLAQDPTALGTIGSLLVGLVAALILAAIGFLVNVVVTNRSRRSQFALMSAIGLDNRQLLRWVGMENGVVVAFALLAGVGLGVVLSEIALPLTAVTQEATNVVPPVEVIYPWAQIALLVAVVVGLLFTALLMTRALLRRLEPATLLRSGDE